MVMNVATEQASPATGLGEAAVSEPAHKRIEELGRIIMAYSEVTERLQESHERLEKTVTALRGELGEKNRLLERKNRLAALGEMAAGMAHEIRNPLGGIQLYASLLSKDVADREAALTLVKKISGGVRRLEALVSQVLQFTREMTANAADTDAAEVIDQAVELAARTFAERQVQVHVRGPRPMRVRVDPLLLGQAVLNLLLNAAEAIASGGGGEVLVSYDQAEEPRQLRLTVTDNGPGIDPGVLDRIFNPFFTTKENGTGLGLAIVHRVVEAHDGTICAFNGPAGGAVFDVCI